MAPPPWQPSQFIALNRLAPASGLSLAGRAALSALGGGRTPPAGIRSPALICAVSAAVPGPVACSLDPPPPLQAAAATIAPAIIAMRLMLGMVCALPLRARRS